MLFVFRNVVARLLFPLTLSLGLLMVGVGMLWFSKKQATARLFVTLVLGLLVLASLGDVGDALLLTLESQFAPVLDARALDQTGPERIKWVVVLNGGYSEDDSLPPSARPGKETLMRLAEGIRLQKQLDAARLLVTLEIFGYEDDSAELFAQLASDLGVDPARFAFTRGGRDTREEAALVQAMVGQDRMILVTSASHMPRAMHLFQARGLQPIAAPTDFMSAASPRTLASFYPALGGLNKTERAVYEYLGFAWLYVRP